MRIRNILIVSAILVSLCNGKAMAATTSTVSNINSLEIIASITSDSNIKFIEEKHDVAVDKKWTVKFTKEISANVVNKDNFQVLDSNGQAVEVGISIGSDSKTVNITAPQQNYKNGQTYCIVIKPAIGLQNEVRMNFSTINSTSGSASNNVDPALIEAKDGLVKVQDIVKTQAEKDLVATLISAVNTKINDSSAVISTASIKAKYNSLSNSEKDDFKSAILSNFSLNTLLKIRSLFQ